MDNDAARHDLLDVLSLVQDQMRDLSAMQQKRAKLAAKATAAEGTVEVTVDAQRTVSKVVVDETYLDDFEFADLGGYITRAAQAAAGEVERRAAALLMPLQERRKSISALSGLVVDAPDFQEAIARLGSIGNDMRSTDDDGDNGEAAGGPAYPTVRR
jgi:DNA-binding protein YbaB